MEKDPLSMSLDDLIAQNKKEVKQSKGTDGGQRSRGRGRGSAGGRGSGSDRGRKNSTRTLSVTLNNPISKPRGRARGGLRPLPAAERDLAALNGDKAWKHDMYSDSAQPRRRSGPPRESGFKLQLSNLDDKVTEDDILELFQTVGPVKAHGIHYTLDRSDGKGFVVFTSKEDADTAMKRYKNVSLDGKPMVIELEEPSRGAGSTLASGIRVGGGGGGGSKIGNRAFSRAMSDAQGNAGYETGSREQGGMRSDNMGGSGRRRGGARATQRVIRADDSYMGE